MADEMTSPMEQAVFRINAARAREAVHILRQSVQLRRMAMIDAGRRSRGSLGPHERGGGPQIPVLTLKSMKPPLLLRALAICKKLHSDVVDKG